MTRANKALVVLVVAALGLWGCAQGPANPNGAGNTERLKAVEAKYAELEKDYKSATLARDRARKESADLQAKFNQAQQAWQQEQESLVKEREDLKQQVTVRTTERDAVQSQFEVFRKGLHNLLIQVDTAAAAMNPAPAVSSVEATNPGKSS